MTDKNAKNENSKIRIMTFFPPFIILVAFLVLSLVEKSRLGCQHSRPCNRNRRRCCHVFQIWRCTNRR